MPSKKNKKTSIQNPPVIQKVARSFLQEHNEQIFKWAIRSDKIDCQHCQFGFNIDVQNIFISKIKPHLDSYVTMKWEDVKKRKSCHYFDVVDLEKELQDRIFELFKDSAPETLFQIKLNSKHRIFGYVEDGIFYLLFNDPQHQGYIVEKKHT